MAVLLVAGAGCATLDQWTIEPRIDDWIAFMDRANALEGPALAGEYAAAVEQFGTGAEAADRLRLAYLLSRPALGAQDVRRSQLLLAEIPPDSAYSPIRDLMARELAQLVQLQAARTRVRELEVQLENLKSIDTDLTEGQAEMEELSK